MNATQQAGYIYTHIHMYVHMFEHVFSAYSGGERAQRCGSLGRVSYKLKIFTRCRWKRSKGKLI